MQSEGITGPSPLEMDSKNEGDDDTLNNPYNIVVTNQDTRLPPPILHKQASAPIEMSDIFGASSNLVNSIVGAGIIGIPYAFKQSGLIAGILLLLLVGYLTDKSLRVIVELASFHPRLKHRNVFTYEDLMSYPFGKIGSTFVLVNMLVLAYGAMVAYLLIIKDTIPTILGIAHGNNGGLLERNLIMLVTSLFVILPLAVQRDMASLSGTSLVSVLADIILVLFIAFTAPISESVNQAGGFGEVLKDEWINPTLFIGLGILSTAMACQHSAFIVSGSLENKTQKRWATVTFRSISTATLLCILLGVCGYLAFLEDTQGDILNNFEKHAIAANIARGLLAVTMFFTYPMESFVARHVILKIFWHGDIDGPLDASGNPKPEFLCFTRRYAVTILIFVATLIPALIVDDIGPVLSITGAVGGSMLSYMAPGIAFIGVNGNHFLSWAQNNIDSRNFRKSKKEGDDVELPIEGHADQQLYQNSSSYQKPFWWYPALMPIWCSLASTGDIAMKKRESNQSEDVASNGNDDVMVHYPTTMDYFIAIFFIIFGAIAMVAGVGSNVYVHINNAY